MALERKDHRAGRGDRFVGAARHAKAVPGSAHTGDYPGVLDTAAYMIIANERTVLGTYRDGGEKVTDEKPANTAGIGHWLKKGEEDLPWHDPRFVHEVFVKDLRKHAAIAERIFRLDPERPQEKFELQDMPHEMQAFIIDGVFNGIMGVSGETRKRLKEGKWEAAAEEYKDSSTWETKGGKRRMKPFVDYLKDYTKKQEAKTKD